MARIGNCGGGSPAKPHNDRLVVLLREPGGGAAPMEFKEIGRRLGFSRQRASYIYHRAKGATP